MTFQNSEYPVDITFAKDSVTNDMNTKLSSEIESLKSELQDEISVLLKLTSVLEHSRKIMNITEKSESKGFLSSLRFFSFMKSKDISEIKEKLSSQTNTDDCKKLTYTFISFLLTESILKGRGEQR